MSLLRRRSFLAGLAALPFIPKRLFASAAPKGTAVVPFKSDRPVGTVRVSHVVNVDSYGRVSAHKYAVNIGDGRSSTIVVQHNYGTSDVITTVYDRETGKSVCPEVRVVSPIAVELRFATPPALDSLRVVVIA